MKAVIRYDDGEYYLQQFLPALEPASFAATSGWMADATDVPDHVVAAYCTALAQLRTIETLLVHLDAMENP